MADVPPGLVWLASFPKSGNTWLRLLIANLRAGEGPPVRINAPGETMDWVMSTAWFEDRALVDPHLLAIAELEPLRARLHDALAASLDEPTFVKTHDAFRGVSGCAVPGRRARGALYILRDPRDVAVSMRHHFARTLDAALGFLDGDPRPLGGPGMLLHRLGDWSDHVTGWVDQTVLPVAVLRYEDLRADTPGALAEALGALGVSARPAEYARAAACADLAELQRQEAAEGFREAMVGQSRFFRSGRVGEWRDVLSPDQVAAIEGRHGAVMARFGYLPDRPCREGPR